MLLKFVCRSTISSLSISRYGAPFACQSSNPIGFTKTSCSTASGNISAYAPPCGPVLLVTRCHNRTRAPQQTTHMFARACIIRSPRRRGRAGRSRNSQAERLGDQEIDDEIEFGGLGDQGIAGLLVHIFTHSA